MTEITKGDGLTIAAASPHPIGTWTIRIDRGLLDRLLETGRLEIPGVGVAFAVELKDGPPANLLNAELVEAVRAVLECHIGPIMSDEKYRALTRSLDDLRDAAGAALATAN